MITPSQVVKHLSTYLPFFTDIFNEEITVTKAEIETGGGLTVYAPSHGLNSGDGVVISSGLARNPLINVTISGEYFLNHPANFFSIIEVPI